MQEKNQEKSNTKYISIDEIIENETPKAPENQDVQQEQQQVPHTPESVVRRSTREIIPLERYTPSLYYLLLTNGGEPESHEYVI